VSGTASDPKFTPDVKGIAGSLLQNALSGNVPGSQNGQQQQQNPVNSVLGLFKKKQPAQQQPK
jgi:hypothetical protein